MKKWLALVLTLVLTAAFVPSCAQAVTEIVLSDEQITVNGQPASANPKSAVYTASDIVFYLAGQDFTYGEGTEEEAHTQQEADAHTVVHITQPGTYVLSGKLSAGQIAVEIDGGKKDPAAVVTLVLNGVDITCKVAPAVIFYNVYECSSKEEADASMTVNTAMAGANVIIGDGTVNNVTGSHVARIYDPDTVELNAKGTKVKEAEKLHKYDAAFYSKRSMNVTGGPVGDGVLNIYADNEGLGTELHLTINGGNINIFSGNDGINTNEDGVSVTAINGGSVNITVTGQSGEGDGIDSNGWLVINGGSVVSAACGFSMDAGIDSDNGIYINGGELCATGNMFDHIAGGDAPYAVFSFDGRQKGGSTVTMKDEAANAVAQWTPVNDFSYLIISGEKVQPGEYTLWMGETQLSYTGSTVMAFGGTHGGFGGERPELPEGMEKPEGMPELPEGFDPSQMTPPEGMPELPEGFDPSQMTPPEGMEKPENMPEPPEGGFGGGFGGRGGKGFGARQPGEAQTVFVIAEDGGTYSGVGAAQ